MKIESENQTNRMRSYLLGQLPESEQIALEQLFFADRETLEHMQEIEFDLIDSYVRGKLPDAERQQFESHYLTTPQHLEQVEFAKELLWHADEQTSKSPSQQSDSFWQLLLASLRMPQFALGAATMAAILIFSGGIWLNRQRANLQQEIARLNAERSAEQQRSRELEERVAQQNQQNSQLNTELDRLRTENAPATRPTLASFILLSTVRGGSQQQTLKIPLGTNRVRLQIKLESNDFSRYQITLRPVDGGQSWNPGPVNAVTDKKGTTISVKIPAARFSSGDYILTLNGVDPTGAIEEVNRYFFRISTK